MRMTMSTKIRTYAELIGLDSFEERFQYLKLSGVVGEASFGFERYLNQGFYRSKEWKRIRNEVILRDNGCDLGVEGYLIGGRVIIHHMNPIREDDIENSTDILLNPDYLVCVSHDTHNAIHYSDEYLLQRKPIERKPWDTCPWRC